jgi:WS/DGAT/MGAT family acyltransferase
MPEPLSPADRSSLSAEQGPINMAVGGVMIFEGGPGMRHERVLERIESRLHLVPKYRQRVEFLAPGITNPVWVDDHTFDLNWHVRRAALPTPGTEDELARFVGTEMSRKLDRSRPLWELTVVEGLSHGRVAILAKMHHAVVDGIAAVDIGMILLDPTPEPLEIPPPDRPWEPQSYDRMRHLASLTLTPAKRAQKLLVDSAARALSPDPFRTASDVLRGTEVLAELARQRPQAPMTPLNRTIGPNRRYGLTRARLADLKAIGQASGGTVNDVILATVAGMLRRYFQAGGIELRSPPVALVPVSVRKEGEEGGNRLSTVFVDLPIDEDNPLRRISRINRQMSELKDSAAVRAGALILSASGFAPPLVSGTLARAMGGFRAFNLVVSNVPGPQMPFYMNGQRLRETYPVVPLNPANQALSIGAISYDGGVHFGVTADRELDPPVSVAIDALRESLDELLATVR